MRARARARASESSRECDSTSRERVRVRAGSPSQSSLAHPLVRPFPPFPFHPRPPPSPPQSNPLSSFASAALSRWPGSRLCPAPPPRYAPIHFPLSPLISAFPRQLFRRAGPAGPYCRGAMRKRRPLRSDGGERWWRAPTPPRAYAR